MSRSTAEAAGGGGAAARVSIWESLRRCGIFGKEIYKEELRQLIAMPQYLCAAVAAAVRRKDATYPAVAATSTAGEEAAPVVVFVNSGGGGRHGPKLKLWLQELMSQEQYARNVGSNQIAKNCSQFPLEHGGGAAYNNPKRRTCPI